MPEQVAEALKLYERLVNQEPAPGLRAKHRRAFAVIKEALEAAYAAKEAKSAIRPRRTTA